MGGTTPIVLGPESILFADEDLVAVDKAAGWLSDASRDPNRDHLGAALERWESGGTFRPAHRLDRATSGVIVFARNRPAAASLMSQFQDRTVSSLIRVIWVPNGREASSSASAGRSESVTVATCVVGSSAPPTVSAMPA